MFELHFADWLNLILRWVHVITGIAWIGASFYFNWLLNHLEPSPPEEKLRASSLWAIHAGGFFHVEKMRRAPQPLPVPLHWFKWEAYSTWLSGFLLLVLIYYVGADLYLLNNSDALLNKPQAIALGLATLFGGWLIYNTLWNKLAHHRTLATLISVGLLTALSIGLCQLFSGRGAYMHIGALLGTIMAANVAYVIMPAQRALVNAAKTNTQADPKLAANAGLRSLHNNYLTLPVVFVMLSHHYPFTFGAELNWLILLAIFLLGVIVRHYFNVRHRITLARRKQLWWSAAAALLVVLMIGSFRVHPTNPSNHTQVSFKQVHAIMTKHCISCHAEHTTSPVFSTAPKGVLLDTPQRIQRHADAIYAQTVASHAMPLGNLSNMQIHERAQLGRWVEMGAPLAP